MLLCINVFLGNSAFFSLPAAGVSRALGFVARREPARTPRRKFGLAEVRGTYSGGFKWQVPSGSDSEHVEPSRSVQTHVQVKTMSDSSCTS